MAYDGICIEGTLSFEFVFSQRRKVKCIRRKEFNFFAPYAFFASLRKRELSFDVNAEHDHAGEDIIKNIGVFQIFVAAMNIIHAITELDFR